MLEYWNIGLKNEWDLEFYALPRHNLKTTHIIEPIIPTFHYSNIPWRNLSL